MDKASAIEFLRQHQPLPPDDELTDEEIEKYEEVCDYFERNADPECIPLFLHSFGEGTGDGLYQLVEDIIAKFSSGEVVPHLVHALGSPHESVRYWAAQIAAGYESPQLTEALLEIVRTDTPEIRGEAITALMSIEDPEIDNFFKHLAQTTTDEQLKEELEDVTSYRQERRQM